MLRFRLSTAPHLAVALALLAACRTAGPAPAIDSALAARVPLGATALAFVDLDQLRVSPVAAHLPASITALLEPFRDAHRVLIAARGVELLAIARGIVPGATKAAPDVSLLGAPGLITAATVEHLPSPLLAAAEPIARGRAIWVVAQGGIALPLEGNLANVNTLLRDTETFTLTLDLADPLALHLTAHCPSPEAALHFEQTLRAIVSLTAATTRRQPERSALWNSVQLSREATTVHVTAALPPSALQF